MIMLLLCLFLVKFFTPAEECTIQGLQGEFLGCVLKGEEININELENITFAENTVCVVENGAAISRMRCDGKDWQIKEGVKNEKSSRRKRGFWGSIARAVTCVATLFSCLWSGRAGPVDRTSPSITCMMPKISVTAEPYQIYAKASWTEPVAHDDTDGEIRPKRRGRAPGSHFPEGRTLVIYEAKDRSGNTATCQVEIIVTVIRCEKPKHLHNGYYQCHPVTDHLYGGGCRFGCYEGFDLYGGPSNIECLKSGKWSNSQPVCKPWKCQSLPAVEGAGHPICDKDFYFRSICTYNCLTGFDMPPKVSKALVCDKSKSWRKFGDPKCIDVEPPVFDTSTCPSMIVKGTDNAINSTVVTWTPPKASDNSNHVHVSERKGLLGSRLTAGIYSVQYVARDAAGNTATNDCSFKVVVREIRCPKLYPTPFLQIACPDGYRTGARCDILCDPGKTLEGSDEIRCERSTKGLFGNWNWKDNRQTICKNGKKCIDLKPPKNGAVACDNWEGGQYCQMQCKNGTAMSSVSLNKLYVCTGSGDWSESLPGVRTCREIRHNHVQNTLGITAMYYFDGDCTDPSTQQQIANNFISVLKNSRFDEVCPDSSECNTGNVQITCGESRRKRRAVNSTNSNSYVEINIKLPIRLHGNESIVLLDHKKEFLLGSVRQILEDNSTSIFGDKTVTGVQITSTGLEIHCPVGSVKSEESWNCIDCPEGTYYARTANAAVCKVCKKGTYQNRAAQMQCLRCPFGKTTEGIGATSVSECKDACEPGTFSRDGLLPCTPCERGYYQSSYGKMKCQPCRESKSTLTFGAVSASECEEFDIEFVPEEGTNIITSLHTGLSVKDFTFAFWLQFSSTLHATNKSLPTITFFDNQSNVTWIWKRLQQVIRQNNWMTTVDFDLPDNRWHYVTLYSSPNCNIIVTVDGIPLPMESYSGPCEEIQIKGVSILAEEYGTKALSQFNLWSGTHTSGYQHRCFSKEVGNVFSWKNFEEAGLAGTFLQFPSLCDDFNNCVSSPCIHGACSDVLHDFTCTCDNGYMGKQCDINKDDCEYHICMNNGSCVDGIANYSCSCLENYTGRFCEIEMVDGGWSEWGNWSECSTTCGDGEMKRIRLCNNPSPDNGGKDCVGKDFKYQNCNNSYCPECPTLSAPLNGSLECFDDTESINCTISCNEGFDFDIEPLPIYHCGPETFHEWNFQTDENPGRRLPECVAIILPKELKVTYTAHYRDLFCASNDLEEHAKEQIDLTVKSILSSIVCLRTQTCNLDYMNVIDCDVKKRERRSTKPAGFALQITSTPEEDNKNETLSDLENAFQNIQSAADEGELTVDVLEDQYELDGNRTDITGEVVCSPGHTRVKFYCVPCGKGAYLYTDYCRPCSIGSYQNLEAQSSCHTCPKGKSTVGIRSISVNDCTVDQLVTLEEGIKVTGIIVGCICAVVVVVFAFFAYRRYKSKQETLIKPTDINMVSTPTPSGGKMQDRIGPSNKKFEPQLLKQESLESWNNFQFGKVEETSVNEVPRKNFEDDRIADRKL